MSSRDTKVIIICPSFLLRIGLSHIVNGTAGYTVSETFSDISSVSKAMMASLRPDIVILDPVTLPSGSLYDIREAIALPEGSTLIALLNAAYSDEVLRQFDASFTITDAPNIIMHKIRSAADTSAAQPQSSGLSLREKEIVALVAKGLTNKEIADRLSLSVFTVTTHRKNISQKLGIRSIAGLTAYAIINGIITEEDLSLL